MNKISFIGAGNVAFRLSLALCEKGAEIDYIFDRSERNGKKLINALRTYGSNAQYSSSIDRLLSSDVVIIAISDDAISDMVAQIDDVITHQHFDTPPLFLHTSGSTDIKVFERLGLYGCRYGVLYPVMTLNKNKIIDFKDVPFLLEGSDNEVNSTLESIASSFNSQYTFCDSHKRLLMHIAAIYSCNFVNYILGLAFELAGKDHTLLIPTTLEGVRNAFLHTPESTLTGPAKRGDINIIRKHLEILDELQLPEHKEIYRIISENIVKNNK